MNTRGRQKTKVIWTIVGPKNARFDNVGIELKSQDEDNTTSPVNVYEDAGDVAGTDRKKYTISIKKDQPEKKFGFWANVSIGANHCIAVDPLIVNAEN